MASSDGIGKAIACSLAREGVHVMMCGRDDAKLAAAMDEAKAVAREGAQVAGERIDLGTPHGPGAARRSRRDRVRGPRHPRHQHGRAARRAAARLRRRGLAERVRVGAAVGRPRRARRGAVPRGLRSGAHRRDRLLVDQVLAQRPRASPTSSGRASTGSSRRSPRSSGPKGITVNLIAPGKIDTARVRWLDDTARRAHGLERAPRCAPPPSARSRWAATASRSSSPRSRSSSARRPGRYVSGTATLVDGGLVRAL